MSTPWFGFLILVPFLVIGVVFALVFFFIGKSIYSNMKKNQANEASPVLTFPARVIGKRDSVSGGGNSSARSTYYVTFERLDLQRIELEVQSPEFGMLAVGDTGRLTHQGAWYQGFSRDAPAPPHLA